MSLKSLLESLSGQLHYGPSLKPLWDGVIAEIESAHAKIAELEAKLAAVMDHPALSIPAIQPVSAARDPTDLSVHVLPSYTIDLPYIYEPAISITESSATGDKAVSASPAQPDPVAAGPDAAVKDSAL
jgi:hypothetical protein